jgi:hypothetical protein
MREPVTTIPCPHPRGVADFRALVRCFRARWLGGWLGSGLRIRDLREGIAWQRAGEAMKAVPENSALFSDIAANIR